VLCDEAVINKSRRMVGILSLGDVSNRRPVIYCPNASKAFRLITTEIRVMLFARLKIYARRARAPCRSCANRHTRIPSIMPSASSFGGPSWREKHRGGNRARGR
jgi:hypothetical protein